LKNSSHKLVPILTFHKVDSSFEWGVTKVSPSRFRTVLQFLSEEGFQTISLKELFDPTFVLPPKPIVLTFDDGYESVYRYAFPLMEEFNFIGTIFVITGYVGRLNEWDVNLGWRKFRHLSWDQILKLKKAGFEIGSHTVNHPNLARLSISSLKFELESSKKKIEDKIGEEVRFISFPFGRYTKDVIDVSLACGYQKGCGYYLINRNPGKNGEKFVLERKAYYIFDRLWNLRAKLRENKLGFLENVKLRVINFFSHGTSLIKPVKIK